MTKPHSWLLLTCFTSALLVGVRRSREYTDSHRSGAGPAAETPQFRVGDRWVYRVREGFRAPRSTRKPKR